MIERRNAARLIGWHNRRYRAPAQLNRTTLFLVSKWMPVIAWMLLIFAGSSDALSAEHTSRFLIPFLRWLDPAMSFQTIAAIHFTLRKCGHFTEYFILAA